MGVFILARWSNCNSLSSNYGNINFNCFILAKVSITSLFIDSKTVEHHLNNIYSKMKADTTFSEKHLRVSAAKLYLETMGEISQWEQLSPVNMAGQAV